MWDYYQYAKKRRTQDYLNSLPPKGYKYIRLKCSACSGSKYYDSWGSPACGACNGTGKSKVLVKEGGETDASYIREHVTYVNPSTGDRYRVKYESITGTYTIKKLLGVNKQGIVKSQEVGKNLSYNDTKKVLNKLLGVLTNV